MKKIMFLLGLTVNIGINPSLKAFSVTITNKADRDLRVQLINKSSSERTLPFVLADKASKVFSDTDTDQKILSKETANYTVQVLDTSPDPNMPDVPTDIINKDTMTKEPNSALFVLSQDENKENTKKYTITIINISTIQNIPQYVGTLSSSEVKKPTEETKTEKK